MKYTIDNHIKGSDSNSKEVGCEFPLYEIRFLDVKDADCIVIMYQKDKDTGRKIVLVDSGNVSDSARIKQFLKEEFNTTVIDITRLNNLTGTSLSIGQRLLIPSSSSDNLSSGTGITYVVQRGDSLYSIARKFNTSVDEIRRRNNLVSNLLSVGQILII